MNVDESRNTPDDPHRGYLRRVLACLLVVLAAWGATDVVMTVVSKKAPTLFTDREFIPGLGWAMRRGFQYEMTYVSSDGFRRSELPRAVAGEIRILVLGDSVTFGLGMANGQDWPSMLEKYLRSRGVPATVMNAGNPGALTGYMFAALKYYAAHMKVDMVLVQNSGNMLAIGHTEPGLALGLQPLVDRLFPDHRKGSLRTDPRCPDMSIVRDKSPDVVSLPLIVKRLAAHSPAFGEVASRLTDRSEQAARAPNVVIPDSCFSPPSGKNYLVREMLAMSQMMEYAARERLAMFFMRPAYSFNWAEPVARADLPSAYRKGYEGSWAPIENVDRMFDFFAASGAGMLDPVSRLKAERGNAARGAEVARLYEDHTHFTAEGARLIARALGDELIARGVVSPVSSGPWKHPAEEAGTRDLRFRSIPGSLSFSRIALAGLFAILATLVAGLALATVLPVPQETRLASAPMLGFVVIFAAAAIANNFSLEPHGPWIAVGCAAIGMALLFVARRRLAVRQALLAAVVASALTVASAALVMHFLQRADERRAQDLRTEIALGEYLQADRDRPTQVDVFLRQVADGVYRPHLVVNAVTSHPRVMQPAVPAIAVEVTRLSGLPIGDAVVGASAAFSAAIALFAFAVSWPLRRKWILAAILAGALLAAAVFTTLRLPSPLTMAAATGLSLAFLALPGGERIRPLRFAMWLAAGLLLYPLQAPVFLAVVGALVALAAAHASWRARSVRRGLAGGLVVLVGLLSARALLFNLAIVDPRLYLILGNQLNLSAFFL